jgi:hypothetical protein
MVNRMGRKRKLAMYITDLGRTMPIKVGDTVTGELERYGVWAYSPNKGKHQCVAVGNDLEALQKQYGPVRVIPMLTEQKGPNHGTSIPRVG